MSAVKPAVIYENNAVEEKDTDSIYNHLHESEEIDRKDYYDQAKMVPATFPPTEEYETIQAPNYYNAYTEVVGEGFQNPDGGSDQGKDNYFVLRKC
jgi:hypothetical protein